MESSKKQPRTQKGQNIQNFSEDQARAYFENLRWPNGPGCVHCGSVNVYRLGGKATRPGLLECRDCRKQFSVTVGSVMEDSHLPLATWARAFHFMCTSKKGMSALQLQRNLGLGSYRTAWFLAHRIREAMKCEPVAGMLKGEIQADETYVGASHSKSHRVRPGRTRKKAGRGTSKTPVFALVETNGNVRSQPVARVNADTLRAAGLRISMSKNPLFHRLPGKGSYGLAEWYSDARVKKDRVSDSPKGDRKKTAKAVKTGGKRPTPEALKAHRSNGAIGLVSATRKALEAMNGDFTKATVLDWIADRYPSLKAAERKVTINTLVARMKNELGIETVREGRGREPALFRKGQRLLSV